MKIAIVGANGNLGSRVTRQALDRGFEVKGFIYDGETPDMRAEIVKRSLFELTTEDISDCEVMISAYGSGFNADPALNHKAFLKYIELNDNPPGISLPSAAQAAFLPMRPIRPIAMRRRSIRIS